MVRFWLLVMIAATAAPRNMISLEQEVSARLHDNLKMTLAPFLGFENFKASVAARLNTDQRKIKEIVFDPDARVERSTKVIKQVDSAQKQARLFGDFCSTGCAPGRKRQVARREFPGEQGAPRKRRPTMRSTQKKSPRSPMAI